MESNMRKMKDSGVEWIGEIPENWEICRVKDHYVLHTGFTPDTSKSLYYDDDGYAWANIADFNNGETIYNTKKRISDLYIQAYHPAIIPKGSLLYSFKLSVGQTAFTGSDMYSNEAIASFWPLENSNLHFLKYASSLIAENARTNIYNANLLNKELIENALIVYPPLSEQIAIANMLDLQCNGINALIDNIQKQIEILQQYKHSVIMETVTKGMDLNAEMKDSGTEWLDSIPQHWNMKRGKYIFTYIQRKVEEKAEVITCFRDGEVTLRSNRRTEGFTMSDKENGYQQIKYGDLVIHGMDGFAGAIGISDSNGKGSPVLIVLDTHQNKRYMMYYFRSLSYKNVFSVLSTGIRVRSCDLSWSKLSELSYLVPPLHEQQEITDYIDKVTCNVDAVISSKQIELDYLVDYKKSLIYEYVTGKNEITPV